MKTKCGLLSRWEERKDHTKKAVSYMIPDDWIEKVYFIEQAPFIVKYNYKHCRWTG